MRALRYFCMVLLSLAISSHLSAQNKKEFDWKTNLKLANDLFDRGSYFNATEYYQKVLTMKPDDPEVLYKLAEADRMLRDYYNAQINYKKLLDKDADKYPTARFYYAQMLKLTGNCDQAVTEFDKYIQSKGKEQKLEAKAALEKKGCELDKTMTVNNDIKIVHLDTKVNSKGTDFAPFPVSATELVFSSIRTDTPIIITDTVHFFNKAALTRLYSVKKSGESWTDATLLPDFINGDMSANNGAFSPDRKLFFYNECTYSPKEKVHCDLYVSRYNNGTYEQGIKLPPQINGADFTSSQPTVMTDEDGKHFLFYSSDRPGGQGGKDIWCSEFDDNLAFQAAKNATALNTPDDELTPFYDAGHKYLYYSSNGLPSIGGFDIYWTKQGNDGAWAAPTNAGKPFNTADDDLYLTIAADQQTGYLASNRPGTISLRSETMSEDIYSFKMRKTVDYHAFAYQIGDSDKTPLTDVKVGLYLKDQKTGRYVLQPDTGIVPSGDHYNLMLRAGNDYKLVATKDKYLSDTKYVTQSDIDKAGGMQNIYFNLDKINKDKTYKLDNIYYDYNSAVLRDSSKSVLDTLYVLLDNNPKIVIELSSHTDSRGGNEFNLKLSQERAESCTNYLISKGIPTVRLIAKGYGEEKPLNKCVDNVPCSEAEYQINRRTEFKVVGEVSEGTIIKQ